MWARKEINNAGAKTATLNNASEKFRCVIRYFQENHG